jgi:plastocyanin
VHKIFHALGFTPLFGLFLFAFSAGFPPLDDATEVDLTLHMVQHVLIILAGVAIAYPLVGRRLVKIGGGQVLPRVALAVTSVLIILWHFPGPWDAAVLNPGIHAIEHLSFLAVGLLAGTWLLLLSDSGKIGALMAAFFGHMGYAVALISPWNIQVYYLYPLLDQVILGWALLLTGPTLVIGVAYIVARNPDWLGGRPGQEPATASRRETFLNRKRVPRWIPTALTASVLVVTAVYFGGTAYALGSASPLPPRVTAVYIAETPVSWQYMPKDIKVVLGVNSTVTWVSRSISYDTVTDSGGAFSSGPIAPGQTFSFTFSRAGTYAYHCQYHPWMTGTVTVLPGA